MSKINIKSLLYKYGLYNERIKKIDYHMNILKFRPDELLYYLSCNKVIDSNIDFDNENMAKYLYILINRCDAMNDDYDPALDQVMVSLGSNYDELYSGNIRRKTKLTNR